MPTRSNGYFNNEGFAQAASNLSSLFAPPSGADAAGWATASAKRAEAARLAELFAYAKDPAFNREQFDRLGVGAGSWAPTQSFYKVGVDDATTRRGQDVSASTSRSNNAADNARALEAARLQQAGETARTMLAPVGQGATRFVPPSIADMYGVAPQQIGVIAAAPGETNYLPDGRVVSGTPKPMSTDELAATVMASGLKDGSIRPGDVAGAKMGSPVQVQTPAGPQYAFPGSAVGQAPYEKPTKPTNGLGVLPDGTQVPAAQGPDGKWFHAQTGQPLPPDVRIMDMPRPQGTNADLGVGKPTANRLEQSLIDAAVAKGTAVKLRDLIQQSPASQGAVGWLRGTAQSLLQTGGELAQFFGGDLAKINEAIRSGAADMSLAGAFDPNIPAIEMLSNLLAFQYAKMTTGERLSNEMLRASRSALGLEGLTANQADATARLNQAIERITAQETIYRDAMKNGVGATTIVPPPAPMPGAPGAPQSAAPGRPERWVRGPDGKLQRAQ